MNPTTPQDPSTSTVSSTSEVPPSHPKEGVNHAPYGFTVSESTVSDPDVIESALEATVHEAVVNELDLQSSLEQASIEQASIEQEPEDESLQEPTPPSSWLDPHAPYPYVQVPYEGRMVRVYGGSFFKAPLTDDFITINLMHEAPLSCDWYVPIRDFSIPTPDQVELMEEIFEDLLTTDKDIYVGCYGGMGRTGLFMSCLLRYMGVVDPITEVRAQYHPHAVETPNQRAFVEGFPTKAVTVNLNLSAPSTSKMKF